MIAPPPARARRPVLALGLALLACAAFAAPGRAQAPAAPDSARRLPSGLELLHLTPAGQPPLAQLDPDSFDELRERFNADSGYVRVALLLSPS
jgi:hypothetical protein